MPKVTVFLTVPAGIVYSSRRSQGKPRSHGFFQFFVFESLLVLTLLNAGYWFREPFSTLQIVSWVLLVSSLAMAVHGFYLLRLTGNPKNGIENTTTPVKRGAYRYIRHPVYSSLLLLAWGVFFKNISIPSAALTLFTTVFLVATAKAEEAENLLKFGAEYATYMKTTKMFIPFSI